MNAKSAKWGLDLARQTIETSFGEKPIAPIGDIPPEFREPHGVFVTIKIGGQLRGCIGSLRAGELAWKAIMHFSRAAAFEDPRFPPLEKEELNDCTISISLLSQPRPLVFDSPNDLLAKLEPHKHGVILERGPFGATFLPAVWDEIPGKQDFLDELCAKAGLETNSWKDPKIKIHVYEAEEIKEKK